MWQWGWVLQMQSPHSLHSSGLTPLHTAILAFNVAMHPPDLCPRVLSTQARDRLACVQMLLHMGADHTSQVSWAMGSWPLGGCVVGGHLDVQVLQTNTEFVSSQLCDLEHKTSLCPGCQLGIILQILAYIYQVLPVH